MNKTKSVIVAGAILGSFVMAASGRASNIARTEYLTMSGWTALPGVVLPPGTYTFEVLEGHPDLVRVTNRATRRVHYTGFTDIVEKPQRGESLSFGEAQRGEPIPIRAWFPDGSRRGNVFRHR